MKRWVKLSEALNSDPACRMLSRAARGVYAQLLLAADDDGVIAIPPASTSVETVAAVCWAPGDARGACAAELGELTRLRVVVVDDERLVIPSHPGRAGRSTVNALGVHGEGARGDKTAAERKRASRERSRSAAVTSEPVTGVTEPVTAVTDCDVTGVTESVSRHVTGSVTGEPVTVTEPVTDSDNDSTSENAGQTEPVTDSCHGVTGSREEKNREEKNREKREETRAREAPAVTTPEGQAPETQGRRRRSKPAAAPAVDPVPPEGTVARRVYEAITTDVALGPIVAGPGDLAMRLAAICDGTAIDPGLEVISAGAWLLRNPGRWKDGAGGLLRWVKSSADRARSAPVPAPGTPREASAGPARIDYQGRRVVGAAGLPSADAWAPTDRDEEQEMLDRIAARTQPRTGGHNGR